MRIYEWIQIQNRPWVRLTSFQLYGLTSNFHSIDDRFGTEMNAFLEYANDEYEKLEATYTNMGKCTAEIIGFYGEDPKKTNAEEFFSDIVTFCNDFEVNYSFYNSLVSCWDGESISVIIEMTV